MKVAYIDQHKWEFGIQPICDALKGTDAEIAPSTYYAATACPSARSIRDAQHTQEIRVIHAAHYGVSTAPAWFMPRCAEWAGMWPAVPWNVSGARPASAA